MITKKRFWEGESKKSKKVLKEIADTFGPVKVVAYDKPAEHKPFTKYKAWWKHGTY